MANAVPGIDVDAQLLDLVVQACGLELLGSRQSPSIEWVAEVHPAFEMPACLTVVATAQRRCAAFATYTPIHDRLSREPRPIQRAEVFAPLMLPASWEDPLAAALGNTQGWPAAQGAERDGIQYSLFAQSPGARITLEFSSPDIQALIEIGQALLAVARMLAEHDATGVIHHYVQNWLFYTSRPKPFKDKRRSKAPSQS